MAATEQAIIRYDLRNIRNDIEDVIKNPTKDSIEKDNHFQYKQWLQNDKEYNIVKYNKQFLEFNPNIGLCRSLIFSNGKVNVFSPPKYLNFNKFVTLYNETQCFGEQIIEGTMINLFYDNDVNKLRDEYDYLEEIDLIHNF